MSLVTAKDIATAIHLKKYGFIGTFVGWVLLKVLSIATLNKIYNSNKHKSDLNFLNSLLASFKVQYDIPEEDLGRIPKTGPFIVSANHPLGGLDGILLLKILLEKRPDAKIIGNFLLHKIEPLKPYVFAVNPFEDRKSAHSSISGIKEALLHLKEGKPLAMFPAGEVSTLKKGALVLDKPWELGAVKLIQKAEVPIVPVYFHAKNSKWFYWFSKMSKTLQTAKLPSELLSQKRKIVKIRMGNPINVKDQKKYKDVEEFGAFIRKKTYMLANSFEKKNRGIHKPNLKIQRSPKEIAKQGNVQDLIKEVAQLRKSKCCLFSSNNYEVFFAPANKIPNLLIEIGRLREIAFRAVGEGTNQALDLDKFDDYYYHMFLWDKEAEKFVGAYRMGLGQEIFKTYGIEGFYVNELFKFDSEMHSMLSKTIELGRAFIVKEYQRKPMPLFLLWKGILHVAVRYSKHKYLTGGVSISNQFSNFSKSLMIEFMKSHYYDPYIAQYIRPKNEYKVRLNDADKDFVFDHTQADLNKFDKIIDEIEPGNLRLPVLIKKYIKQNAKLVAFNVDPKFNDAIDGLIFMKVSDIPKSSIQPILDEFGLELDA